MRGTRSCRCEAPVCRCVGFFESAEAAAPEVPPKSSAAGSAERGGPTSYHRVCRTGTPAYGTGWGCGDSALRGSSASGAGASIARGCPPRTSPLPAADLRAEARTHCLVAKSAVLRTPCGSGHFSRRSLAPQLQTESASLGFRLRENQKRKGGQYNERKQKTGRDPDDPRDPGGERRHHRQRDARREEPHVLHSLSQ